jgi:hypothetical protein
LGSSLANTKDGGQDSIGDIMAAWDRAKAGPVAGQLAVLDMMGNSGRLEFLPVLEAVISGEGDIALKSKAVFSLRLMDSAEARRQMVSSLTDSHDQIRTGAVAALTLAPWSETYRAPLETCAAKDPSPQIKSSCQRIVSAAPKVVASSH